MLIKCGGRDSAEDDDEANADPPGEDFDYDAACEETAAIELEILQSPKLALLELLQQHGVAVLKAHADGSGDSGELESVECFAEPAAGEFEECETPDGVEELVETILEASNVNFDNDGGFFNLTITTATRQCVVEIGWYYTESNSNTNTETL